MVLRDASASKNTKREKNIIFRVRLFCVLGFMENCQTSQIWLQFLKTVVPGNISDAAALKSEKHFQHTGINILVSWVKTDVSSDTFT